MAKPKYYVTTWDYETGEFTPQRGVRTGPYRLMALRQVLLRLRDMGYEGHRGDSSVLIERREKT